MNATSRRSTATQDIGRRTLTLIEVAEIYGLSSATWRRLVHQGKLPAYRVGASMLVKPADVEAYLEGNPVEGPVECRDGRRKGNRTGRPRKASAAS